MQPFLSFLLFGLLLVDTAHGGPISHKNKVRSFKVPRIRRSDVVLDGPSALNLAYAKYGIIPSGINFSEFDFTPLPPGTSRKAVANGTKETENGAVKNQPTQNDVQYLSPVTIGGQEFVMNFDTGSSDTWVFNTQLDGSLTQGHAVFDPAKSTTFSELPEHSFNITYGDSSFAFGTVGLDTIDIGGATVEQQAIGLPSEVSASFAEDPESDGLVGLGFSKLNTVQPEQQLTFFDNIAEDLEEPVFTAQLKAGEAGVYEFGTINESRFTGDLVDVPVNASRGFWEIQSSKFMIGNNGTVETVSEGAAHTAVADTGTTLMLLNDEITEAYYAQVPGADLSRRAGGFIYPCETTLPDLLVSVGDTHLVRIPGELAQFTRVGVDTSTGTELCFGGIQSNQGSGLQIWGDVFFKSVFAVFDQRGPMLRLGAHA